MTDVNQALLAGGLGDSGDVWRGFAPALTALVFLALLLPDLALGAELPSEVRHAVYVLSQGSPTLTIIDDRTDQVSGTFSLASVPVQIEVSSALPRLIATDGRSNNFAVVDLASRQQRIFPLDFPARRLFLSEDGLRVGVSDLAGGDVAIFDLSEDRQIAKFSGLSAVRDVTFGNASESLTMITDGSSALTQIDVGSGARTAMLSTGHPVPGGLSAFTKSPNGRNVFARGAGGGPIEVIDVKGAKALVEIDAGQGPSIATPSGTGAYLLIVNAAEQRLSIVHGEDFKLGAVLPAMGGALAAYSGWFDSVAFLASGSERRLLVYDLWRLSKSGEISLPARPGAGTVTRDGAKLYLPLPESAQVAVIDTRFHRLQRLIDVGGKPASVTVAAGYGICH
jgi:DNA-binding beta-propeller fold protein YncE